jgi:hypothetical protein
MTMPNTDGPDLAAAERFYAAAPVSAGCEIGLFFLKVARRPAGGRKD